MKCELFSSVKNTYYEIKKILLHLCVGFPVTMTVFLEYVFFLLKKL